MSIDLSQVIGAGSWYNQLQSVLTSYVQGTPVAPVDRSFMLDKGHAIMMPLDTTQAQISAEQATALVVSLNDSEPWAVQEHATQNALEYVITNMQQQLELGVQWLNENVPGGVMNPGVPDNASQQPVSENHAGV